MWRMSNLVHSVNHVASSISEQSSKSKTARGTSSIWDMRFKISSKPRTHFPKPTKQLGLRFSPRTLASPDTYASLRTSWTDKLALHGSSHRRAGLSFKATRINALESRTTSAISVPSKRYSTSPMALRGATNWVSALYKSLFEVEDGHPMGRRAIHWAISACRRQTETSRGTEPVGPLPSTWTSIGSGIF